MGHRRVWVVVLVLGLAGCNVRQQVAGGGAGLMVGGLLMTYSGEARRESTTADKVGISMILIGLATLFTAAALDEAAKEEATVPTHVAREIRRPARPRGANPRQKLRDQAWELTREAQLAARNGDCPRVALLAVQVGEVDHAFYGSVFVTDLAIQRCLAPAPAPVPPAAPVEAAPPAAPVDAGPPPTPGPPTIPSTSVPMPSTTLPPPAAAPAP